jgi:hypothetical protein
MKTKAFAKSRDERKRVEMRFAHLKTHHGFERMPKKPASGFPTVGACLLASSGLGSAPD